MEMSACCLGIGRLVCTRVAGHLLHFFLLPLPCFRSSTTPPGILVRLVVVIMMVMMMAMIKRIQMQ